MKTHRWLLFLGATGVVAACGSRTGLLLPTGVSAGPDALPPIDVMVPPDAPSPCTDGGSTLVYLITSQNVLLSFYPPQGAFTQVGVINCPVTVSGDAPFSMAVSHEGVAYVAFQSGSVFEVSTLDANCRATSRVPSGTFANQYGMGFSGDPAVDGGETLYLAGSPSGLGTPIVLGSMSTSTFETTTVGEVVPNIYESELTGTASGQLFGFYAINPDAAAAAIGEIDRTTGQLVAKDDLPSVNILGGWAFAFWGGDFYTFTAPGGPDTETLVQRFRPSDGSIVTVATTPGLTVVGAGVSTCAPQR
jgi:hypothetical protein